MEKRTFLAIILSIFVLIFYQNLFVSKVQKDKKQNVEYSQHVVNKEVKDEKVINNTVSPSPQTQDLKKIKDLEESTVRLENEKISLIFSNIGGKIKQVELKGKETLPIKNISLVDQYQNVQFDLIINEKDKISYKYVKDGKEIVKTYILSKQEYTVNEEILFKNINKMSNVTDTKLNVFNIDSLLIKDRKDSENGLYEYRQ